METPPKDKRTYATLALFLFASAVACISIGSSGYIMADATQPVQEAAYPGIAIFGAWMFVGAVLIYFFLVKD